MMQPAEEKVRSSADLKSLFNEDKEITSPIAPVCRQLLTHGIRAKIAASMMRRLSANRTRVTTGSSVCRQLLDRGVSVQTVTSISKILMACSLSVGTVATVAPEAVANSHQNKIVLSGTVEQVLNLSTSKVDIEVSLDGSEVNNLNVGNVTLRSNCSNGYRLTVTSLNNGVLKKTNNADSYSTPYTLSYDGASPISLSGTQDSPVVVENKTSTSPDIKVCAVNTGCTRSLNINVKESDLNGKPAGIYRDTLIFNIIAN